MLCGVVNAANDGRYLHIYERQLNRMVISRDSRAMYKISLNKCKNSIVNQVSTNLLPIHS